MFDIAPSELLVVGLVALVVIGPKELPNVMRHIGRFVGKAKGMARHFRSGFDAMVREAELEEMEKRWRDENERIMREHPADAAAPALNEAHVDPSTAGLHEPEPGAGDAKPAALPQS